MTLTKAFYNGDSIDPTPNHLTSEQKMGLLDWHPIFMGRCPNCERPIRETTPTRGQWDCVGCRIVWYQGWYRGRDRKTRSVGVNFTHESGKSTSLGQPQSAQRRYRFLD